MDKNERISETKSDNRNYNDIKVNNNFQFTINFGDSLNLLALLAGVFLIKTVSKKQKTNKRKKTLTLP
ncbi:hypothetical protein [Ferdinandcohnia sp. Marseille-Q9671]